MKLFSFFVQDQNSLVEEFENEKEKIKVEFEKKWNLKKEELEKELEEGFEERMTTKVQAKHKLYYLVMMFSAR